MQMLQTRSLLNRMRGAALLEIPVYEDVEADTSATVQAALVVGIVSVCSSIGAARGGPIGLVAGVIAGFLGWGLWAGVTYIIGDKIFKGTATWGELLRTLGFAQTPGVLFALGIIPVLGGLAILIASIWMLIASIIAIRQALDFSTGKAIGTALIGWFAYVIVGMVIRFVFGIPPQIIF
jgi:hypothetical protein